MLRRRTPWRSLLGAGRGLLRAAIPTAVASATAAAAVLLALGRGAGLRFRPWRAWLGIGMRRSRRALIGTALAAGPCFPVLAVAPLLEAALLAIAPLAAFTTLAAPAASAARRALAALAAFRAAPVFAALLGAPVALARFPTRLARTPDAIRARARRSLRPRYRPTARA